MSKAPERKKAMLDEKLIAEAMQRAAERVRREGPSDGRFGNPDAEQKQLTERRARTEKPKPER